MYRPISSSVTKFKELPRAEEIQPDREIRRGPRVAAKEVPRDLRSVPGSPREPKQEHWFARHFPEPNFKLGILTQTYYKVLDNIPAPTHETHKILKEKYGDLIKRVNQEVDSYHEKPPASPPDPSPDLTKEIKAKAKEAGVDLVGITRFDRTYVTAETKGQALFKHVIVLCRAFDWNITHTIPSVEWDVHSYDTSLALSLAGLELADFIRSKGYRVQFIAGTGTPGEQMIVPILPYAIAAGLGQMGANGTMLTPEFGSRVRVIGISTDAPVTHDKPVDYGINILCEKCQVCVQRCPGRALPNIKVNWHGVTKYKIITERCQPMLKYAECNICTKVCPVQHFGLKRVLDHYRETDGQILGKGTDELESYTMFDKGRFGVGERPKFNVKEGGKGLIQMAVSLKLIQPTRPVLERNPDPLYDEDRIPALEE